MANYCSSCGTEDPVGGLKPIFAESNLDKRYCEICMATSPWSQTKDTHLICIGLNLIRKDIQNFRYNFATRI
jgi:hypothetical protein